MKELNLCDLLKCHEGETFYSPLFGDLIFEDVYTESNKVGFKLKSGVNVRFMRDGRYLTNGECLIFPSKEQRDWRKWEEEQKATKILEYINYRNEAVADTKKIINWEQRRYEIVKAVIQGIWSNPSLDATFGQCTEWAIEQADNLINKLKENSHD